MEKLRREIPSDMNELDLLHHRYDWLPNSTTIRPDSKNRAIKEAALLYINSKWLTLNDYILYKVYDKKKIVVFPTRNSAGETVGYSPSPNFNSESTCMLKSVETVTDSKFSVEDREVLPTVRLFKPNEFPYDITRGNHWVMWYATKEKSYSSEEISAHISESIVKILTDTDRSSSDSASSSTDSSNNSLDYYDFAWYVNPKMTVIDYFHVQVFWVVH